MKKGYSGFAFFGNGNLPLNPCKHRQPLFSGNYLHPVTEPDQDVRENRRCIMCGHTMVPELPLSKECTGRYDECASDDGCECVAYCIMAANNHRRSRSAELQAERERVLKKTCSQCPIRNEIPTDDERCAESCEGCLVREVVESLRGAP